jgi:polysaccharide export outer membrane protein
MNRRFLPILLSFTIACPAGARVDLRRESFGARPLSMGGAFLAVDGDAASPLWNPAGLSLSGTSLWGGGDGRFVTPMGAPHHDLGWTAYVDGSSDGKSALGAWWTGDEARKSRRLDALGVTWAREFCACPQGGRWIAGASAKFLGASYETAGLESRSTLGLDLGLLYVRGAWTLGASARDLNEPRLGGRPDAKEPAFYGAGAAYRLNDRTLFSLDATQASRDEPLRAKLGAERRVWNGRAALRAGVGRDRATAGVGLGVSRASVDYGFAYPFDLKKNERLHAVSLSIRFGGEAAAPPAPQASAPAAPAAAAKVAPEPGSLQWRTAPSKANYPLGPDDLVHIAVKDHPELDANSVVDPRGAIHLAFIGDINVKGLTPQELEAALKKIYAGFFTEAPSVDVTVKDYNSRFVYVVGAVKAPGKYPLKGSPQTLRDVIFMAGLPTERAALWRVFIVRQTPQGPKPISVNFNKIMFRGQLERDIEIQSGDVVYVPMGFMDVLAVFIGRIVGPIMGAARNAAVAGGV